MPKTQSQFNAIQKTASSDSLVNRLLAGRTAAASAVRSPHAPVPTPAQVVPPPVQQPQAPMQLPVSAAAPVAPTNMPVKSHTVTNPDGSSVVQTYHKPEDGQKPQETPPQASHEPRYLNGMHHVPFKSNDGSIKYINAKGEIH